MLKKIFGYLTLTSLLLLGLSWQNSDAQSPGKNTDDQTVTRSRMLVVNGSVTMDLDLNRLKGIAATQESKRESVPFEVGPNSFFTILAFNDALRGALPGSMELIGGPSAVFPEPLNASANQLSIERLPSDSNFELVIRDGKTGFVFFNIEGHLYKYDAAARSLGINGGRLLLSEEFANKLGRPADASAVVGEISIAATVHPIEVSTLTNGAVKSATLPPRKAPNTPQGGGVPGPDIIVGTMSGLAQFGSSGTQVGLATGATSCNNGDQTFHFYLLPNPDHSVVSQNFYRMSGGADNAERFEQLGHSWNKHVFGAAQENGCGFGCDEFPDQSELGVGCSDPYAASQNAEQDDTPFGALGSRAWINPFTGTFPVNPRPERHVGHTHSGTSHRILAERNDLNPAMNPGATYYLEVQYDSPQEYAWCQNHPTECNMYNNASYRRYNVNGTTNFTFAAVGSAVRMTPATGAWTGATSATIEPEPGVDGRAFVVYKVTNPSAGVWHYEYAIHNQNLDRSIQSFSVPLGNGITLSNVGFRAPPNHPGFPNDGTVGDAGFSNAAWTATQTSDAMSWNTETFAQNPNANAIRFGTLYNFRFDSNRPPQAVNATIGFLKTGTPITVGIQGPSPEAGGASPTPTPSATGTPSGTPGPTATPSATATPGPGPGQTVNLSTRLFVQTGDNVGIGGFIITGAGPKTVLLRAIGPSLIPSIPNAVNDTVLELHGTGGFPTVINNNWEDDQEAEIFATGIAPTHPLESAILATLDPGAYTGIVRGNGAAIGVALIEVYDLDPGATSKVGNIATRAFVGTGDDIVIAGFILGGGSGVDAVGVRGLGPSLSGVVPNTLANPTIELRDNNGAVVRANDDWQDDPAQAAIISAVGLAPGDPLESAIAAALVPGPYTVLLAGVGGGTGNGLVEIYDLATGVLPTPTPGVSPTPGVPTPTPTPASPTPSPTPPPASPTPTPPAGDCVENFDGQATLPPGWTTELADGPPPEWAISTTNSDSAPNNVFVSDTAVVSDKRLISRPIGISSASASISFRNNWDFEFSDGTYWDGGVLEVSVNGGAFVDVTNPSISGGTFVSGGYNGTIDSTADNPLSGQPAWADSSGGYVTSTINLIPGLQGQSIVLRWRAGTDQAEGAPGWRIDNLTVTGGSCPP